jgi:cysteinyl-tRNA synthetase
VRKHILNRTNTEWTVVQQQILQLTDQVRAQLHECSIQLEDTQTSTHVRVQTNDITQASKEQLEEVRRKSRERQAELERLAAIPPHEYLRDDTKYSAYDELGIPTHTINGEPLTPSQRKKLEKRYYKHKRTYEHYRNRISVNQSKESSSSSSSSSSSQASSSSPSSSE